MTSTPQSGPVHDTLVALDHRVSPRRASPSPAPAEVSAIACELAIVVPTFNERDNVRELVSALEQSMAGVEWEIVFVDDDSSDSTADAVRTLAATNRRVRCVQRIGRRGLSSACVEGILATSAPYVAVMDADLQHDESILPEMLARLKNEGLDVVVGSRHVGGGSLGDWDAGRARISSIATRLSRALVPAELGDPMSGYFVMTRTAFMECVRQLSSLGFKILVDLFASSPRPLRFAEVGYTFRNRRHGESKLDSQVAWDYLMLLLDKTVGRWVPVRFVAFSLVGGTGVFVHMAVLALLFKTGSTDFTVAQASATGVAMVFNFAVNNILTYRDRRLSGWAWLRGLASFMAACGIGALANVGIAEYLFDRGGQWLLAGLAGILVGAVWNYSVTAVYTWRRRGG